MQNHTHKETRFRVVFLLQDLYFGGTQRHTLELARRLDPSLFQAEIWLLMSGDDFVPLAQTWELSLTWLGRSPFVGPDSLVRLWWRLKTKPVDLLVLLTGVPNIWGRLLGRLTKVPLIVGTWRGTGCPERNFEKWLWPLADHFLCNAAVLKKMMIQRFQIPDDRITVIHNGVDLNYFCPGAAPLSSNKQVVLCIARLVPEKDHETLIAAFSWWRPPRAELWLVGDGPKHRAIASGKSPSFLPTDAPSPGQSGLSPILQQSSLLVLSSIQELPNVVWRQWRLGCRWWLRTWAACGGSKHGETGWLVLPRMRGYGGLRKSSHGP
jgi:glycosyltransferase involved in cell wall biosynthesis